MDHVTTPIKAPRRVRATRTTSVCVLIAVGMLMTIVGGAQAVVTPNVLLRTAGQFAVLAGSGITNTGASTSSGDTGSSPTSTQTGFTSCPAADCVAQTGANHTTANPNDAVTQGAKTDLTTAYNDASGRSPTTVATELAGQTLVGGIYTAASGTFGMSGTLVLDGENNLDTVFIFQTASTLITGGTGNVTLIRGAQACNVYWKVGSAATLGAGSTFRGTIMAHDDISLGNAVTVDGRLLAGEQGSGAGAVTLIHDTITKPAVCATQADADAAVAAAAQAASAATAAAQAAATAQAAADQAAAAKVAATKAAEAANVAAAALAATKATQAAQVAATNAAAAKAAAAKASAAATLAAKKAKTARVAKAKAAAVKAAAAAALATAKANAASIAAARASAAAQVAATKAAAAKRGHALPARQHAGFTG